VITDFKTGRSVTSYRDAEEHPQLAAYQVAGTLGAFDEVAGVGRESGGAELIFVRSGAPQDRPQPAQSADETRVWTERLAQTADDAAGARLTARIGDYCRHCPVRSSCPVQPDGRQVTEWE